MKIKASVLAATVILVLLNYQGVQAQSDPPQSNQSASDEEKKFEIGVQFSVIRVENLPVGVSDRRNEPGFGGRFAYNFDKYAALESRS